MSTVADATDAGPAGIWRTWRETPTSARLLLAGTFVNRLGGFLQIFAVLYLVDRGFSSAQAAFALGGYGAGSIVGMLAGGGLSDRFGARRTIVTSMAGSALLLLGVLYLQPYPAKLVTITAVGLFAQAYRPAAASALSGLAPPQRQVMIFAMHRLAINLGMTALPLLGLALLSISYDALFWGEALAALTYAVIAALALPRGLPSGDAPAAGDGAAPGGGDGDPDPARGDLGAGPDGADLGVGPVRPARGRYLDVLADRRYLLFLASLTALSLVYVQYMAVLPLAIRAHGMGTATYGGLIALNGALVIALELLVATVVQRWRARTAIVTGMLLTAVGLSAYAPAWGLAGFVAATVLWTLGEIIGAPTTYFAYPAQAGPATHRGRYLGAANGVYGLGSALGPVVGILVWNRVGDGVWLLYGLVALVGAGCAYLGVRAPGDRYPDGPAPGAHREPPAEGRAPAAPAQARPPAVPGAPRANARRPAAPGAAQPSTASPRSSAVSSSAPVGST
jgi:predicted MFS family arabinose efflux permease